MDLNETIRLCQLGDKDAFRELFSWVENKALSTAYLISGSRGIAEDILQEAYIKCFKDIKSLRDAKAFNVWFYRILVRTGWNMSKKHSQLIPMDPTDIRMSMACDYSEDVDVLIDRRETQSIVKNAVGALSYKLRETVILYYFNEMSIGEIAKVQGCLKATVKSRLHYARAKLKTELMQFSTESQVYNKGLKRECK